METTTILQLLVSALCGVLWFNYRDLKGKNDATAVTLAQHKEDHGKEIAAMQTAFDKEVAGIRMNCDKELAAFKVYVAQNHVTHQDLAKALDNIEKSVDGLYTFLRRIEEKLDNKQDKVTS